MVVLPAVNWEPVPGVMKALSFDVEVCAAESEKVARRPNARLKKRILLFVRVFFCNKEITEVGY